MYIKDGKRFNIYASATFDGIRYHNFTNADLRALLEITWVDEPEPPLDYTDDTYYRVEQDDAPYVVYTPRTPEQIAQIQLNKAKTSRQALVQQITVTTSTNKVFDGDESSQDRIARAISALDPQETTNWVLADNTVAVVTREELREALRLAGAAQTQIWVTPYTG